MLNVLKNNSFYSRMNRPVTVSTDIGTGERSIFEERIVDGEKKLVVTGRESIKDFIEASKNDTLISNIMKRFENGDINALSKVQGFYADVTSMPTDLASSQKFLISLENIFNKLPVSEREKFDFSFNNYVSKVSNMSVEEFTNFFNLNPNISTESEVVENES